MEKGKRFRQGEHWYKFAETETFYLNGIAWERDIYMRLGSDERYHALMFFRNTGVYNPLKKWHKPTKQGKKFRYQKFVRQLGEN